MENIIYVTEPKVINLNIIKELLPTRYNVLSGNTAFENVPNNCSILLIRSGTTVDKTIKDKMPALKSIIRIGTGLDNIDVDFCNKENIAIYNSPGANADAVSDYVVTMMLVALRKIHRLSDDDITSWNRFKFVGHSMSNRRIGIIGFGNIGRQVFTKLQAFNCKSFIAYDPFLKPEDMPHGIDYAKSIEEVLQNSDTITLHVPLLESTKYLINENNLNLLKPETILINASRGGIVNEEQISHFINNTNIVYIADTVENEPHITSSLLNNENVIVTPHIASLTEESEDDMIKLAISNFINHHSLKV